MFRSQPQTQPHRRVTVYRAIGRTDGSKTKVVRPSAHCAVELRHYCYWIQRGCTPSGHFSYFPTDALHPLSRWNGAKIGSASFWCVALNAPLFQKIKVIFRHTTDHPPPAV